MDTLNMQKKPEIVVFAGPNGSDLEAAQKATKMREECIESLHGFTFETVLSTRRNLDLLIKAKNKGYFIRCIYVLRVKSRFAKGGHDVPEDKIISRYHKAINLLPELINICDICHIYDNSLEEAFRIFKKRKSEYFFWENELWQKENIEKLTGAKLN